MLKIEDLKEGEYYHSDYDNLVFIFDGISNCNEIKYKVRCQIYSNDNYFTKNGRFGRYGRLEKTLKLATKEQKHWLNECIKADKFIPYEETIKTFNEEPFCIELNSQEELDAIISFYKEKGYTEYGNSRNYKKGYVVFIRPKYKEWQTAINNERNYPIKTLSELGIIVESERKTKFEVGKWYKINNCWWGKYNSQSDTTFYGSESISSNGTYYNTSFNAYKKEQNNSFVLLTDLSEIQQYLPPNHPDLIINKSSKIISSPKEETFVLPVEKIEKKKEELKQLSLTPKECYTEEITIPKVVKTKQKIDFRLENSKLVNINIPIFKKPKKQVKFIKIEKFELSL